MKQKKCSICGSKAVVTYEADKVRGGTLYGVMCDEEGHYIDAVFETKNRAIKAWNECQDFVERYTEV